MTINITRIKDTDPANAATFNKPLDDIESHLTKIYTTLGERDRESIVLSDMAVSTTCSVGSLVRYDESAGEFVPARAVVNPDNMKAGKYIEAAEANVVGMVVSKSNERIADILVSGWYDSKDCTDYCLIDGTPGTYYLSDTEEGKASKTYSVVAQPVLTYIGSGMFIMHITRQMPYQYDPGILRGIQSESSMISVKTDNYGITTIDLSEYTHIGEDLSPTAISSINEGKLKTTPVITDVVGVGSISVDKNPDTGAVTIGDEGFVKGKVRASEYNLNGAKKVSDDIYTYMVFPASRNSSISFSKYVPCTGPVDVKVWANIISSSISTISADIYVVEDPVDGLITLPGTPVSSFDIDIINTENKLAMATSTESFTIDSNSYVYVKLNSLLSSSDIKMLDAGFVIGASTTD